MQTGDGYIWLATFGGLARFDGVKFTVFSPTIAPALKSQRITALYEDRPGNLWIGAETGEIVFYRNGEFFFFDVSDGQQITDFFRDDQNVLWVSDLKGVTRYVLNEDGSFISKKRVTLPTGDRQLPQIRAMTQAAGGTIWFVKGTFESKTEQLVSWKNGVTKIFTAADGLISGGLHAGRALPAQNYFINDVATDRDGILYTVDASGLNHYDGTRFIRDFPSEQRSYTKRLFSLDANGNLWANFSDSVAKLENGDWVKYDCPQLLKYEVRSFFVDRENNLWFGTNADGLIRLKRSFVKMFDAARGITNNQTATVLETKAGEIFAAGLGLHRFENDRFVSVPEINNNHFLTALGETRNGTIYVGGFNEIYERRQSGKFADRAAEIKAARGGKNFAVKSIFEDSHDNLWLGLFDGLLRRGANGEYREFHQADGLPDEEIQFIYQARDGALWFGTLGGASRFDGEKFTNYTVADGLASDNVRSIYEDTDGALWFGTYGGGLSRLKNGRIKTITMRDGLFDDVVSRLIVDERDDFWMLGNRGIFIANRNDLNAVADGRSRQVNCRSYGKADGMTTSEGNGGNQPAGWRARDGNFWFPTISGYARIAPTAPERFVPPALIEEARLENRVLDLRQPIQIKPGQQNLEIHYTGLSYTKPELIRFRYKLENLDGEWTEAGTLRTAYYNYLPPGEYIFTVVAANADGVWNEQGASVRIIVLSPFYRTWWFVLLVCFSIIGLAFAAYRIRVSRFERDRRKQQDFSRRLIELQEQERKRIAAELHDSLSQNLVIIRNRAMISLQERKNAEYVFEQIEEIAEAAGESLSEVRAIAANLRPFQIDRLGLTKAIEAIARKTNSPRLKVTANIDKIDKLLRPEMEINLYRIVQESLNNVIKHSGAKNTSVTIRRGEKIIELEILDDGRGFDLAGIASKESANGSGFGLTGIYERARILGSAPVIESSAEIGTTIRLKISI